MHGQTNGQIYNQLGANGQPIYQIGQNGPLNYQPVANGQINPQFVPHGQLNHQLVPDGQIQLMSNAQSNGQSVHQNLENYQLFQNGQLNHQFVTDGQIQNGQFMSNVQLSGQSGQQNLANYQLSQHGQLNRQLVTNGHPNQPHSSNGQTNHQRKSKSKMNYTFVIIHLICGSVVLIGSSILLTMGTGPSFYRYGAYGIGCVPGSLWIIVTGLAGILSTRNPFNRCYNGTYLGFNVVSVTVSFINIILLIVGMIFLNSCVFEFDSYVSFNDCNDHKEAKMVVPTLIFFNTVEMFVAFMASIFGCLVCCGGNQKPQITQRRCQQSQHLQHMTNLYTVPQTPNTNMAVPQIPNANMTVPQIPNTNMAVPQIPPNTCIFVPNTNMAVA